jgi:tRNA nucleotidyltransferase (CCA-adding enzyme)
MLRAVRFAVQLDFEIDGATEDALAQKADTITRVSVERIASELCRMLGGKNPSRGLEIMSRTGLLDRVLALPENPYFTTNSALFSAVDALPRESMLRLSLLLCGADEQSAKAACRTLKLSTKQTDAVAAYIAALERPTPRTDAELRRYMADVGEHTDGALRLSQVCGKIPDAQALIERCERIRARGDCLSIAQLAVGGRDLMNELGLRGSDVGKTLAALLDAVLDDPEKNEREGLLALAKQIKKET